MQNSLRSICIVGGGTAGWMAASLLSSSLRGSKIKLTVVESPDIATIGVGESTVPSIMDFIQASQLDLKALIQACAASFKLGIRFNEWAGKDSSYFHPFGKIGKDINGFDFYQAWLKSIADGHQTEWLEHSPSAVMAQNARFMLRPHNPKNWVEGSFAHALHLDAVLFARYLRDICIKRGVRRVEATVSKAVVSTNAFIERLELHDLSTIESDFFIDCTGFSALLSEQTLKVGYEDWSHYLPCDRAVTVQSESAAQIPPYTTATALPAGWAWNIPLQHRQGNGYVFASRYCTDAQATDALLEHIKVKALNTPKIIPFKSGKRNKIWHKNCLALGLSAGFLEPLESTAIHLVYKTLVHFIKHFPDRDFDTHTEQVFNQKIDCDYEEVRDFIILHYYTSKRRDSEFWQWCRTMPIPDSLRRKLLAFEIDGRIDDMPGCFFTSDSWCSILEGMGIRPKKYHPLLDAFSRQDLAKTLSQNVHTVRSSVASMPFHTDFIKAHCATKLS